MKKRSATQNILLFFFCMFLIFFACFPFLQIVSVSFKTPLEWGNPNLIPRVISVDAYKELLGLSKTIAEIESLPPNVQKILNNPKLSNEQRQAIIDKYNKGSGFPFLKFMFNSFALAMLASCISLIVSILGSYAISRLRFRGKALMQRSVLFVYLLGGIVIMVPLYQMANGLSLTSTNWGLITSLLLIYVLQTLPLALYMLGNYIRGLPVSLDEAAKIDGCGHMRIIFNIIVPLSRPIIATVFIYCFIIAWNEYLYASVFLKANPELYTIPIGIQTLFVSKNAIWARIMAASTLTLTPILLFFVILVRNVRSGMVAGGVKE